VKQKKGLGAAVGRVVDLLAALAALVGPGEVGDGNDEEAGWVLVLCFCVVE
jgi:hypothetical protein